LAIVISPREVSEATARLEFHIDQLQADKLARFGSALASRGLELGVVAASDASVILERHVLDSLRGVRAVRSVDRSAYDLGSGGGLPGVPIAIALPELRVTLVEARRLRAAWLELIVEDLSLPNASVSHFRIEELTEPVDVCFARALGPPDRSWAAARPLLRPGGRLAYFAGAGFDPSAFDDPSAELHILDEPDLESGGPVVIIAPQ
jgi:16S rRNA (guanine527-N7)-methyltransferase